VRHPVVGAGLETLLRLEHRFETKRIGHLQGVASAVESWSPDVALVDGVLLRNGECPPLGVAAIVLTGSAVDGEGLQTALDDPRGWLRKDATAGELFAAIDRVCGAPPADLQISRATLIAAIAGTGVMLFLAWGLLVLRASG
jgi:hypothetical protein